MTAVTCKGGATIVIGGGDNVPPNTHECGGQGGGTKLLGDPILHMH